MSIEERRAEVLLEALDLRRERGLRQCQATGGAAQCAGVGGLDKGSQENCVHAEV